MRIGRVDAEAVRAPCSTISVVQALDGNDVGEEKRLREAIPQETGLHA